MSSAYRTRSPRRAPRAIATVEPTSRTRSGARQRPECVDAAPPVGVERALQGRNAELLAGAPTRWAIPALGEGANRDRQLAARHVALDDGADDGRAEQCHCL